MSCRSCWLYSSALFSTIFDALLFLNKNQLSYLFSGKNSNTRFCCGKLRSLHSLVAWRLAFAPIPNINNDNTRWCCQLRSKLWQIDCCEVVALRDFCYLFTSIAWNWNRTKTWQFESFIIITSCFFFYMEQLITFLQFNLQYVFNAKKKKKSSSRVYDKYIIFIII